jgi:hypothetical protein
MSPSRTPSPQGTPPRYAAPPDRDQAAFARKLVRDVAQVEDPLTLERWASSLLGRMWERTRRDRLRSKQDPGFALGIAMIEAIGLAGGRGAKMALHAIAQLDDGSVGWHAEEWSEHIKAELPEWITEIGQAKLVRAASVCRPCDGEMIFIEALQPAIGLHTLAVFVDDTRGGMAKHLGLIQPLDSLDPTMLEFVDDHGRAAKLAPVELVFACGRIRDAITQTDRTLEMTMPEEYADLRALALTRVWRQSDLALPG